MSIAGIIESLQQGLSGGSERSLVFPADKDFASTLTLGQIIKGRAMRHYEGGRYGIAFNGQEKVVDATFPLRTGDVIYARVVGIDEKVHLQRVVGRAGEDPLAASARDSRAWPQGPLENRDAILQLFDRYQAKLTSQEHQLLLKLQAALGGSRQVAVSALILSKLGMKLDAGLIKAIHRAMQQLPGDRMDDARSRSAFSMPGLADGSGGGVIEALAAVLNRLSQKGPAALVNDTAMSADHPGGGDGQGPGASLPDSQMGQEERRQQLEWFLGQWLLNAQTPGAVAHRFLTIPLWFNDALVEVTLALFAQKDDSPAKGPEEESAALRYRKVVFALETEALGHVEVQARLADRHVRVEVVAENEALAEYLGSKMALLDAALSDHGWLVDGIGYAARSDPQGPLQAVVEHFIAQDSLNLLM